MPAARQQWLFHISAHRHARHRGGRHTHPQRHGGAAVAARAELRSRRFSRSVALRHPPQAKAHPFVRRRAAPLHRQHPGAHHDHHRDHAVVGALSESAHQRSEFHAGLWRRRGRAAFAEPADAHPLTKQTRGPSTNFFVLRMVLAVAVSAVFSLTANAQAPYPNQGIRSPTAIGGRRRFGLRGDFSARSPILGHTVSARGIRRSPGRTVIGSEGLALVRQDQDGAGATDFGLEDRPRKCQRGVTADRPTGSKSISLSR